MTEELLSSSNGGRAWRCGADQTQMEPAGDAPSVLRCPQCGHRTDTPGSGSLADGFDVAPYQWGLRGDPNAWWAMRDALAHSPTPPAADATRLAYAAAFRDATGVDLDGEPADRVYREHLDQGGMSGGTVHLPWWRDEGVPLLVERAMARRPEPATMSAAAPAAGAVRAASPIVTVLVWAVLMAIPAALLGGGGFLLYQRAYGTHVRATVTECGLSGSVSSGYRDQCTATWTIDGTVVVGPFNGGNGSSDVGTTVDATVRGDTAYSRSLALPIILLVLGLPFLAIPISAIRRRGRRHHRG